MFIEAFFSSRCSRETMGFEPRTLGGSVGWLYLGPTISQPSHLTIMTWDDDGAMAMVEGEERKGKGVGFALSLSSSSPSSFPDSISSPFQTPKLESSSPLCPSPAAPFFWASRRPKWAWIWLCSRLLNSCRTREAVICWCSYHHVVLFLLLSLFLLSSLLSS